MRRIGLVLSGGMAKGAYQVGVLQALSEYFAPEEITYTAASSIGVLNAYAFHTGRLDYARKMWRQSVPDGSRKLITAMLRSTFLQNAVQSLCRPEDVLDNSLYISLYNATTNQLSYIDLQGLPAEVYPIYLRASICMPLYNRAVMIDDDKYFDGALVDNIPVYPIAQKEVDYVICIYFERYNYLFEDRRFDQKVIKLTFPDNTIVSNSVIIQPERVEYMLERGYEESKAVFDYLFAHGTQDVASILRRQQYRNLSNSNARLRITADFMITNLNRVARKITRKKKILD